MYALDDPDVCCVRPAGKDGSSLSWDQSVLWATLQGITGQLLMTSDRMYDLPPEHVDLVKRLSDIRLEAFGRRHSTE